MKCGFYCSRHLPDGVADTFAGFEIVEGLTSCCFRPVGNWPAAMICGMRLVSWEEELGTVGAARLTSWSAGVDAGFCGVGVLAGLLPRALPAAAAAPIAPMAAIPIIAEVMPRPPPPLPHPEHDLTAARFELSELRVS